MTRKITVNRLGLLFIFVMGCHLGRPPAPTGSFAVGQIVASVAEPGLETALKEAMASALASRTMLAESDASAVDVAVLAAVSQPTSAAQSSQTFAARLQISVRASGRSAQFSLERSYTVIDPIQGEAARNAAFHALAQSLSNDAAEWLAHAPKDEHE